MSNYEAIDWKFQTKAVTSFDPMLEWLMESGTPVKTLKAL